MGKGVAIHFFWKQQKFPRSPVISYFTEMETGALPFFLGGISRQGRCLPPHCQTSPRPTKLKRDFYKGILLVAPLCVY